MCLLYRTAYRSWCLEFTDPSGPNPAQTPSSRARVGLLGRTLRWSHRILQISPSFALRSQVSLHDWQQRDLNWGNGQSSSCRTFSQYLVLSRHSPIITKRRISQLIQYSYDHFRYLLFFFLALTSSTGHDVASLPAGRSRLPSAVELASRLPAPPVNASDVTRLESVTTTSGGALSPGSDAPVKSTRLSCAVTLWRRPKEDRSDKNQTPTDLSCPLMFFIFYKTCNLGLQSGYLDWPLHIWCANLVLFLSWQNTFLYWRAWRDPTQWPWHW